MTSLNEKPDLLILFGRSGFSFGVVQSFMKAQPKKSPHVLP